MFRLILSLLLPFPAWCQFLELVATDDGQQVYFTTQFLLRAAPAGNRPENRVYRAGGDGRPEVFAERVQVINPFFGLPSGGASGIRISGDGRTAAVVFDGVCNSAETCTSVVQRVEIRGENYKGSFRMPAVPAAGPLSGIQCSLATMNFSGNFGVFRAAQPGQ